MSDTPFKLHDTDGSYVYEATRHVTREEIIDQARRLIGDRLCSGPALTSPRDAQDYLMLHLAELEHEVFAVLYLDNRHRVLGYEEMFRGTINGATVHPREVVKAALRENAAAVMFAHNHPSGIATPSRADEQITRRLADALALIDVRVLDHFVVGGSEVTSFAERGLL